MQCRNTSYPRQRYMLSTLCPCGSRVSFGEGRDTTSHSNQYTYNRQQEGKSYSSEVANTLLVKSQRRLLIFDVRSRRKFHFSPTRGNIACGERKLLARPWRSKFLHGEQNLIYMV